MFRKSIWLLIFVTGSISSANAAMLWNGGTGDWSVTSNWDLKRLPTASDDVRISDNATVYVTQDGMVCNSLYLGSANGTVVEITAGKLQARNFNIGYYGIGTINQSGGILTAYSNTDSLGLGCRSGDIGYYNLSGTGQVQEVYEYVGLSGTGTFTQSGGVNTFSQQLFLGYDSTATGTYILSSGKLQSFYTNQFEYVGYGGTGTFLQSGGTHSITGEVATLYLGYKAGASGSYYLSGSGQLSVAKEYIGYDATANALFQQSGGTNTATYLSIGAKGKYILSGGMLQINGSINNTGALDFAGGTGTLSCSGGIIDFMQPGGIPTNTQAATLTINASTLLMVPAGYDPVAAFAHFNNQGVLYTSGSPVTIPSGYNIVGYGVVSFSDHVTCQGSMSMGLWHGYATENESISLNNGLTVSGSGSMSKIVKLVVDDLTSGISGGSISANMEFIGNSGTGLFTHSTGTNTANILYLGYSPESSGTYSLNDGRLLGGIQYVGYSGNGYFSQSGTAANSLLDNIGNNNIYIGFNAGATGLYSFTGSGILETQSIYVGYSGTGTFSQSAGNVMATSTNSNIFLGYNASSSGIYNLSGTGAIYFSNMGQEFVGYSGTGVFNQSGGTNSPNYLYLGYRSGSSGTYNLSAGSLSRADEYIGYSGNGNFAQSGGTNTPDVLHIGDQVDGNGTYVLSGTGYLSSPFEYLGSTAAASGLFQQTGGTNTTPYLTIASGGRYELSGGTLQISDGGFVSQGVFDGGKGSGVLAASNSIIDMTKGTWQNLGSATLNLSAKSLLIVPAGFDPAVAFGVFNSTGLVHTAGTTLTLATGQGFGGIGSIDDRVVCQGTIIAASVQNQVLNLNNGLVLASPGSVSVSGLTVNDTVSGVSGGSLSVEFQYVGKGGTGLFAHSGGTNSVTYLYFGYDAGSSGSYRLEGTGNLTGYSEYVGHNGVGTFIQSSGTNTVGTGNLYVGNQIGSSGAYILSNTGSLSSPFEYIGYFGTGAFTQSAGVNSAQTVYLGFKSGSNGTYELRDSGRLTASGVCVGYYGNGIFTQSSGITSIYSLLLADKSGSSGTYNLNGGTLEVGMIMRGPTATFNFGGGTLKAKGTLSTNLPMTLTGIGGNATVDTIGYAVTFSGQLSGPGGLNKLGTGTLTLSAANSYAGPTTVNAGILSLTGSLNSNSTLAVGGGGFSYAPTAHSGTGNIQSLAALTVNTGLSAVNASAGNTLALGGIVQNIGGVTGFNNNATGTITTTQTNTNDILGPWATYGSGTSMMYAACSGSSPYVIAPYSFATAVTSGLDGFDDMTGTVNYALTNGGGAITANVNANTLQFTGAENTIAVSDGISMSLNGVMNVASATATITGGNLIIGSTQELVFTGPGKVTVRSMVQDNVSGNSALVMAGSGALALSRANSYSGGTYLLNGTLCVNDPAALGSGLLTICGGALDNTSAGAISFSNNNPQAWNANFTFVGSRNLDLGTGPVALGDNIKVTVQAGTLTVGGAISGPYSLTKVGAGALSLAGANSYSGGTTLSAGQLNVNNATALGMGIFTIAGNSTIDNTTAGPITLSTNNPQMWNANFTFTGTQSLNLGAGPVTLGADRTVTVNANTLAIDGPIGGGFLLTKIGPGTLSLSSAADNSGVNLTVNAGTLILAKNSGDKTGAVGALASVNIVNGTFDNNGSTETIGSLCVGYGGATIASGYARVSSGTLTATSSPSSWYGFDIGNAGSGVFDQSGGTLNVLTGMAVGRENGFGVFNLTGGTVNINTRKTGGPFDLCQNSYTATGILTVKGTGQLNATSTNVTMWANSSIINLGGIGAGGGLLNTASIFSLSTGLVNFHGGTMQANTDTGTDLGWYNGGHNTGFLIGTTNYVYSEGAVIDTNGHNITISTPLLAPTGNGLTNIAVSAGGTGYIGAPAVKILGGGGKGATAYATIDSNGAVTGIVITNPGVGYTSTPTVTLVGGGGAGATLGSITIAPNSSGGLLKLGDGTLTLAGANTYTGNTIVSSGMLKFANTTGSATGMGSVMINAGATLSGAGLISGPVTIGGTLAPGSSPGILTVNNQVTLLPTAFFNAEVFDLAAGTGYDQLITTGPVSLAGSLSLTFGNFTPTGNDVLFLINNTGISSTTGTFQYPDNAKIGTFNGCDWYITYDADNDSSVRLDGGNDVAIYSLAVPEPMTLAQLAAGLLVLVVFARRKRWQLKDCSMF